MRRRWTPDLERIEVRELPSGIIATMAAVQSQGIHSIQSGGKASSISASAATNAGASGVALASGFVPSTTSIALPSNQDAQGINLALTPTGNLSPREIRRKRFSASFVGTYAIGPGRTDTEAKEIVIRGAGGSNQFLHGDIQIRLVTPLDPSIQIGGVSAMFDRSINSNSSLGLDLAAPQSNVDSAGRPNKLSISLDTNESSGLYDEGFAQGIMTIRYLPSGAHTPGVSEQGTAIVKIQGQVYTTGVDFILTNSWINPGGPSQGGPRHRPVP